MIPVKAVPAGAAPGTAKAKPKPVAAPLFGYQASCRQHRKAAGAAISPPTQANREAGEEAEVKVKINRNKKSLSTLSKKEATGSSES